MGTLYIYIYIYIYIYMCVCVCVCVCVYVCDRNYHYSLRNNPEERSSHIDDLLKFVS